MSEFLNYEYDGIEIFDADINVTSENLVILGIGMKNE